MCYKFNMNFNSTFAIFVSSFIIGLSGALMPGPLLVLAVRGAARHGFRAAPLLVIGHGILEAGLVALILLGLADWLKGDLAAAVIATAGGGVLLWMAVGMAREVRTLRFEECGGAGAVCDGGTAPGSKGGSLRVLAEGAVASLTNPYWVIWWATIGLGYLVLSRGLGRAGVAAFFGGHILADAAWYLFVGGAVALGRGRVSDRVYRVVVGGCAAFLAAFAISFGWMGVSKLARLL